MYYPCASVLQRNPTMCADHQILPLWMTILGLTSRLSHLTLCKCCGQPGSAQDQFDCHPTAILFPAMAPISLLSLLGTAAAMKCPGSSSWIHASAEVQAMAEASCADVSEEDQGASERRVEGPAQRRHLHPAGR
ncbi:unnamed protein product [Effrenium voratum]|nr:unnamed protein product [Effrenium voratum]CAJ1415772.1 unnamed protein product [Effrenium voratum]